MSADRGGVMGEGWRGYRKKGRATSCQLRVMIKISTCGGVRQTRSPSEAVNNCFAGDCHYRRLRAEQSDDAQHNSPTLLDLGKPTHGNPLSVLRTSLNMELRLMKKQKIRSMNKSTVPRGEHLSCLQNTGPETVGA
ncbi:unnamed protein product [Leuciscus chuanchicus]